MANNTYYYYDDEARTFVEIEQEDRPETYRYGSVATAASLVMACLLVLAMDLRWIETPQEATLKAENEALQEQIARASERMQAFSSKLDELAETDQELYRTLLQAEPISEDVRQVGVGGADPYRAFDRFTEPTAVLLRETAHAVDELERRIRLQGASFRELSRLAEQHQEELRQLPALLPASGPVVSGFGLRRHPILHVEKMHAGIDVLLSEGSPVVAPGDGLVRRVGRSPGYGLFIDLEHPATGYTTRYAHLSEALVGKGEAVERGQKIALSGNSGRTTGPHLHYEVRDAEGRAVNPVYFFAPSMTPEQYRALLEEASRPGASLD